MIQPGFAAQTSADPLAQAVKADLPSLTAIYRDLHTHPELSFKEGRSAGIMAATLLAMLPPLVVVIAMQRWFVRGLVDAEK